MDALQNLLNVRAVPSAGSRKPSVTLDALHGRAAPRAARDCTGGPQGLHGRTGRRAGARSGVCALARGSHRRRAHSWRCARAAHTSTAQDPSIREISQQLAGDPAFRQATSALQSPAGAQDLQSVAAQMQAMQGVFNNPAFMQMAQRLGAQMMQARWRRAVQSGWR